MVRTTRFRRTLRTITKRKLAGGIMELQQALEERTAAWRDATKLLHVTQILLRQATRGWRTCAGLAFRWPMVRAKTLRRWRAALPDQLRATAPARGSECVAAEAFKPAGWVCDCGVQHAVDITSCASCGTVRPLPPGPAAFTSAAGVRVDPAQPGSERTTVLEQRPWGEERVRELREAFDRVWKTGPPLRPDLLVPGVPDDGTAAPPPPPPPVVVQDGEAGRLGVRVWWQRWRLRQAVLVWCKGQGRAARRHQDPGGGQDPGEGGR